MTFYLKRRREVRPRLGNAPQREYPKHKRWVRGFCCAVFEASRGACSGKIEAHHLRTAANSGKSIKPHDANCVPLCALHHAEYHTMGRDSFARQYQIDLGKIALTLARQSPVREVQEFARTMERE